MEAQKFLLCFQMRGDGYDRQLYRIVRLIYDFVNNRIIGDLHVTRIATEWLVGFAVLKSSPAGKIDSELIGWRSCL